MEAIKFPHDHDEGRYTRYHLYDTDTNGPWCTTKKRSIFDNQPLTMADFRIVMLKLAPDGNMCQTCLRRKNEYVAATKLIGERAERTLSIQPSLF